MTNAQESLHSDEELREIALDYLKGNRRSEYRQLVKDQELEGLLALRVRAAKDYAQSLMVSGESLESAWNRAIRLHLLKSESD